MDGGAHYQAEWRPHEARLHNNLFGTMSRPMSRNSSRQSQQNDGTFSDAKIPWDHYGKKYRIYIKKSELDKGDLYQVLLKKVHKQVPNFHGVIAYNDYNDGQVVIYNDHDIRQALREMGQQLHLYSTVVPNKGFIAAADMRGARSQSVPPPQRSFHTNSRAPSSLDSNYQYQQHAQPNPAPGLRPMATSPNGMTIISQSHAPTTVTWGPAQNLLLAQFLAGTRYPFAKFSWVGPNKYHNFGPYPYKHFYNKGGWGPSW